ncbi:MAG: hypothetical protein NC253_11080 [Ruminococcus sp.]|nr:hypothetical protein [Ruminococcus sp.]MCM1380310.1 hypothetical protein [Muribaculaceae bacterium]MCM1478290.1 hypothetical protein [Muribaculaceae bacterium]
MTNYEYLKTLSVEEMAAVITDISQLCDICEYRECALKDCQKCNAEWLNDKRRSDSGRLDKATQEVP